MPNEKSVGIAFADPALVAGTTITGAVITNSIVSGPVTTVAATGSTNTDAAPISATTYICVVTAADATKGVILPAMVDGQTIKVKNNAAAVLKVYPFSGAAINGLTATTGSLNMAANTLADFTRTSATQLYSTPLLPS